MNPVTRRIYGIDLGKRSDFTAFVSLSFTWPEPFNPFRPPATRPTYDIRAVKRWPLGTEYLDICAWLVRLFQKGYDATKPAPILVCDETGVGIAAVEMIRKALQEAGCIGGLVAVTITAGNAVTMPQPGVFRVAKKQLASVLVSLFAQDRLRLANVPERETLLREAQAFVVKVSTSANESFEAWRDTDHDDTILALALACWAAEWMDWPDAPTPPVTHKLAEEWKRATTF